MIAPGSRSAPLVLALAWMPGARCHMAGDERAAGYGSLGKVETFEKLIELRLPHMH